MERRHLLLGATFLTLASGYGISSLFRPKSDLELLGDSRVAIFPADPLQQPETRQPFPARGALVIPFARFSVSAMVLSARSYDLDDDFQGHALPFDLALGWGAMSSPWIINHVDVSQRGRFYFWYVPDGSAVGVADVIRSSSNMHIFPADEAIETRLSELDRGSMVRLEGWLIDLDIDGKMVRSSRHRQDTGPGACEIVLVERIFIGAGEIGGRTGSAS